MNNTSKMKYSINPVNKKYYFLTPTERTLIRYTIIDWPLQNYVQKMWTPETTREELSETLLLVDSMSDVELIESLANLEHMTSGGDWQSLNPKDGHMSLAVRTEIYELFKNERTKNTKDFFDEQGWDYSNQLTKELNN